MDKDGVGVAVCNRPMELELVSSVVVSLVRVTSW